MIRILIDAYIFILIIDAVVSYFPNLRSQPWANFVKQAADMTVKPIRKILPPDLPFDVSHFIVMLILVLFKALW